MTPSLSAVERGNPPPRRKSCNACIKAKRRCDLGVPACLRCLQRKLECTYPTGNAAAAARKRGASARQGPPVNVCAPAATAPLQLDPTTQVPLVSTLQWSLAAAGENTSSSSEERSFNLVTPAGQDVFDVTVDMYPDPWENLLDTLPEVSVELPQPAVSEELRTLTKGHGCVELGPPPLRQLRSYESVSRIIAQRLQYAIDKMLCTPAQMINENRTPWCHPHLWVDDMPRSMEDAFSSCALHVAKNSRNSDVIHRCIDKRVRELVASPAPVSARETLARVQALLLYQIMGLFDGDVHARASAENTTPALESAALALLPHIAFDGDPYTAGRPPFLARCKPSPIPTDLPGTSDSGSGSSTALSSPLVFPNPDPSCHRRGRSNSSMIPDAAASDLRAAWEYWVFQESTRRTFLMVFFFLQTYRLVRLDAPLSCDGNLYLINSWTMSAKLWEADDPFEFARAWREDNHFVVVNGNFSEVFEQARGDDLEVFGKILVSALIGIDEAKGWLLARGGTL